MKKIEKERKFKLSKMPSDGLLLNAVDIEQYYIKIDESEKREGYVSKRIRAENDKIFTLTLKSDGNINGSLNRIEEENEISNSEFDRLKKNALKTILKTRHKYSINDFTVEIDKFINIDLILAEVESDKAEDFKVPQDWLEVTKDPFYKNEILAVNTPNNRSAMICLGSPIPQVITESIEAMVYYKHDIPDVLYLLHTTESKGRSDELRYKIYEKLPKIIDNEKSAGRIEIIEIYVYDDSGGVLKDILNENDASCLEKCLSETMTKIINGNFKTVYYNASSGRKAMSAMLSYFAQLYGTENDILFQVQLLDKKINEKINEKKIQPYWYTPEDIAYIPIPFYKVNESEIYRIISYITDHKLKQSFISFYNRISTPSCSKLLYGFNLYDHFADHGLNHSLNILKILADLLEPANNNGVSLSAEEVYILSCAIILHDIGMCGSPEINDVGLVRKYHGLITYDLLINDKENLRRNKITDDGNNDILDHHLTEIAIISKYHQKVMKFFGEPDYNSVADDIIKKKLTTLEKDIEAVLKVPFEKRKNHRSYKLASLLSVLDAADVQVNRVFDYNVLKKQIEKNKKEIETLAQIIKYLCKSIPDIHRYHSQAEIAELIKNDSKKLEGKLKSIELKHKNNKENEESAELLEQIGHLRALLIRYDEIKIQEPQHYHKHMTVKCIKIKNGAFEIIPNEEIFDASQRKIFPRVAQKEIKDEISRQFKVLMDNNIKLEEVRITGIGDYEEEKKYIADNKDCFEHLKDYLKSSEFMDEMKKNINIRIEYKKPSLSKIIDHYYDDNNMLLKINNRLRIRTTSAEGYQDYRICFKKPSKDNKSTELEPLYYEAGMPPEVISCDSFKKYFGDKILDLTSCKGNFQKQCIVETERNTHRLIIESLNDEDYLWLYEIEVSCDAIKCCQPQVIKEGHEPKKYYEIELENKICERKIYENVCYFIGKFLEKHNARKLDIKTESKYKKCMEMIKNN